MKVAKVEFPINFKENKRLYANIKINFVNLDGESIVMINARLSDVIGDVIHRYYETSEDVATPMFALPLSDAGEGVEMESIGLRIMLNQKFGSYRDFFKGGKKSKILVLTDTTPTFLELREIEGKMESLNVMNRQPELSVFDDVMREIGRNNIPRVVLLLNGKKFTKEQKDRAIESANSKMMKNQLQTRMKISEREST